MKRCPYCAEEIQDAAVKCKHCGEFLEGTNQVPQAKSVLPWYFKTPFIILMLASIGPLALPLIWWHPRLGKAWKIGISIVIVLLTWFLVQATVASLRMLNETYTELLNSM